MFIYTPIYWLLKLCKNYCKLILDVFNFPSPVWYNKLCWIFLYYLLYTYISLILICFSIYFCFSIFYIFFLYFPWKSITLKINSTIETYTHRAYIKKGNINNIFPHINIKKTFITKYITIYTAVYHLKFKMKMDIIKLYNKQNLRVFVVWLFIQLFS